ncbi:MAG: Ig-like domain-containing protein, partial [Planctomycetota bacterium]
MYAEADTTPPTIISITRKTPASSPTNADSVIFTVTFDEDVTNVDSDQFTAEPTDTVAVGTPLSVTGSGASYEVTIDAITGDGTLGLTVATGTITDLAGNTLDEAAPTDTDDKYTIDNTPPAAPSTPDLAAGSDSGDSDTDNLTNVTTPEFTGTAEANATIDLFAGATAIATGTADGAGDWTLTADLSSLVD